VVEEAEMSKQQTLATLSGCKAFLLRGASPTSYILEMT
jgi:hypothetical protein